MKWLVIVGAAAIVIVLARVAKADTGSVEYATNPNNWDYIPGHLPGSGVMM